MGKLDPDEARDLHNKGEQDASEGRTEMAGGPWQDVFESDDHYKERLDAYRAGRDNHYDQK